MPLYTASFPGKTPLEDPTVGWFVRCRRTASPAALRRLPEPIMAEVVITDMHDVAIGWGRRFRVADAALLKPLPIRPAGWQFPAADAEFSSKASRRRGGDFESLARSAPVPGCASALSRNAGKGSRICVADRCRSPADGAGHSAVSNARSRWKATSGARLSSSALPVQETWRCSRWGNSARHRAGEQAVNTRRKSTGKNNNPRPRREPSPCLRIVHLWRSVHLLNLQRQQQCNKGEPAVGSSRFAPMILAVVT